MNVEKIDKKILKRLEKIHKLIGEIYDLGDLLGKPEEQTKDELQDLINLFDE